MIIDGNRIAKDIIGVVSARAKALPRAPRLGVLVVGEHPVIASYGRKKERRAKDAGVDMVIEKLPDSATEEYVLLALATLTKATDALIVQLPLPPDLRTQYILSHIKRAQDADVLGDDAYDFFDSGKSNVLPPVVGACAEICMRHNISIEGKKAVVIGSGRLVGRPIFSWLTQEGAFPRMVTKDTNEDERKKLLHDADIIVSGVGKCRSLKKDDVREGVVVLDAGTSEESGTIGGDADPEIASISSLFTPVPGGIGPITVAYLFHNTVLLCEEELQRRGKPLY